MAETVVRGRFAPSPSGRMHLGNAWSALVAWLAVRSRGGVMVLRLEDLDPDREQDGQVVSQPVRLELVEGEEGWKLETDLYRHLPRMETRLVDTDRLGMAGGDVEVGAQGCVQFQPVLVVALHPVHLAVAAGKMAQGPEHLIVVFQRVHPIVFREDPSQIRVQLVVGGVPHPQHVDAVVPQANAEPAVGLREIR